MPDKSRRFKVHGFLALIFVLVCAWQGVEHVRVRQKARAFLLDRAREISTSLSVVIRSQSRFGIIPQDNLLSALNELVASRELRSVALFNSSGEIVASAGDPLRLERGVFPGQKAVWSRDSVMITNIVDLGTGFGDHASTHTAPILVRRPPRPEPPPDEPTTRPLARDFLPRLDRSRRRRPSEFRAPPWMTEAQFREFQEKQGLHGFVLGMATDEYRSEKSRDFWLRAAIIAVTLIALLGMSAAWKTLEKAEELRIRLVKAGELNRHLSEMNIAAAGLAHETRNPLNLVRVQAQMISRETAVAPEIKRQALSIVEEVDRVTNRLSEFINYSRPAAPRPVPVRLAPVVEDVERALSTDITEKAVQFKTAVGDFTIEADEGLLRQVLFNLVLNAIEAVDKGGAIEITAEEISESTAMLSVRDNGCGIPPENRDEVFRPYFTTHEKGTGLGLAVVQRIVQAHMWHIEHKPAEPGGTVFILSGLKVIKTAV